MHHRVIGITNPAKLSQETDAFRVEREREKPVLIPYDDIGMLIIDSDEVILTSRLVSALAERNIGVIFTGQNHMPSALVQPYAAHTLHAETLRLQMGASVPKAKSVWKQIVTAKIRAQASLLSHIKQPSPKLASLADQVLSGDSRNHEAQAASLYWKRLMGAEFYRDASYSGANSMLNYGYAVLRAMVARALCGAGLHPAIGVHHRNRYNPFALADDAMEPFRPLVDAMVYQYLQNHEEPEDLTPPIKRYLVKVTVLTVRIAGKDHHILEGLEKYAAYLRRGICEDARKVTIPEPIWSAVTDLCG